MRNLDAERQGGEAHIEKTTKGLSILPHEERTS